MSRAGSGSIPVATDWHGALADALRLVVPVECAGCGRWDLTLCRECRALLLAPPAPTAVDLASAPDALVWSVGTYAGALRAIVLAWKNRVRLDLGPEVESATADWVRLWAADPRSGPAVRGCLAADEVLVVPAPSGWRRRAAGRLVVAELADAVGRALPPVLAAAHEAPQPSAVRVRVVDVLRRRGGSAHQSGRGARSRAANRRGTVRAQCDLPGSVVILVDDVVTTGATLDACAEELRARGATVVAALTLAAAPAPTSGPRVPGGRVLPDPRRVP